MREKRDWRKRRKGHELTPEKLIHILESIEAPKEAAKVYKALTGLNPPPKDDEIVVDDE